MSVLASATRHTTAQRLSFSRTIVSAIATAVDSALDAGSASIDNFLVAFRRQLMEMLAAEPRTASSLARELQLDRRTMEDDLRHMIRSARAAGHHVVVEPARCRACGFLFDEERLTKPGRCPQCRSTWLFEPRLRIEKA